MQDVYRLQGVKINDKHFEVIVRQMMRKVQIEDPGDTRFLEKQLVNKNEFNDENDRISDTKRPITVGGIIIHNVLKKPSTIEVDEATFSRALAYPLKVSPNSGIHVKLPIVSSLCFKEEINMIANGNSTNTAYAISPK